MLERKRAGRPRLYPRVKAQIEELVDTHGLEPGVPLESENQLAARFGVSRSLVRKALSELAGENRIVTVVGKGHFVADPRRPHVEAGAIVCVLGSTGSAAAAMLDDHVAAVVGGLESATRQCPHRLLWEVLGPGGRDVSGMVKPHLADLRGLVLVPLADQSVERMIESVPPSVARVVAGRPASDSGTPCVYVDYYASAAQAVKYLLELGHQRIGFMEDLRSWPGRQRFEAYRAGLAEAGLPQDPAWVAEVDTEPEHDEQVATELLERAGRITALIVAGSRLPWILRAIHARGLRLPDDLSLVAFDDVPVSRQHLPAITVVRQPADQLGVVAGQMLLQTLGGGPTAAREMVLKCELVVRGSARSMHGPVA